MKSIPLEIDEKDLEGSINLSYSQHQELAARVMVKIMKNEKNTTLEFMDVHEVNSKSDVRPMSTPISKSDGTLMCTLLHETSNYVNLMPKEVNSKSEGTPISKPTSKSVSTPMATLKGTLMSTPSSKSLSH